MNNTYYLPPATKPFMVFAYSFPLSPGPLFPLARALSPLWSSPTFFSRHRAATLPTVSSIARAIQPFIVFADFLLSPQSRYVADSFLYRQGHSALYGLHRLSSLARATTLLTFSSPPPLPLPPPLPPRNPPPRSSLNPLPPLSSSLDLDLSRP